MNLKYFYSLMAGTMAVVAVSSCSPDDHELAAPSVTPADLVEGKAFTVTPDANDPNIIHLTSLMKGVTPVWSTPQGRSQSTEMTIELPFSGEYEVTYGVITQAGTVYGDPYKFTVSQNNFGMLSDPIWTNLAGGVDENGNGNPKKWVPVDKNYGVGRCTGPVMYMDPSNVLNDGSGNTDLQFGSANWAPNWDPGFQSWLIPADDPYMDSYMIFGLDPVKGCTLTEYRGTAAGGENATGTFTLNTSDMKHLTVTFNGGTYSMHNTGFDEVCSNYTNDIKIIECTPYLLQIATMRTNSEGAWWIVWNFIWEEVKNGNVVIPGDGPELLPTTPPSEPSVANLAEELFKVNVGEFNVIADQTTLLLNEDAPYDWMWWNPATGAWEAMNAYGASWAPALDGIDEWALTLEKRGKATLESPAGEAAPNFTIEGSKIVFDQPVTLFTSGNVDLTGTEFTVFKCSADDNEIILGVPDGTDADGNVNKYLVANCTIKSIGGGQQGPTVVPLDASKISCYIEANDHYRIQLYNPWGGDPAISDISKVKLRKGQTMTMKFTLKGVTWKEGAQPKVLFGNNIEGLGFNWPSNGQGFDVPEAFDLNKNGETTISITNTTGSTATFEGTSVILACIQIKDMVESPLADNGLLDPEAVTVEGVTLTIE